MSFKILENGVHEFDNEFASFWREVHSFQDFRQLDKEPEEVNGAVDERRHRRRRRRRVDLVGNQLPTFDTPHDFAGGRRGRTRGRRGHQNRRSVCRRRPRVRAARRSAAVFDAGRAAARRQGVVHRVDARAARHRERRASLEHQSVFERLGVGRQ